jgi:N-formylglutamate amidohydrolase
MSPSDIPDAAPHGHDDAGASPAPGVRRLGPVVGATPLVFASPHSGDIYPEDLGADPALSAASLRSAEDALIDRIAGPAAARIDAPLLCGLFGRAYVDLNRAPDDLDPLAVAGLEDLAPGPRARAGYGVIPRLTGDGRPLRPEPLPLAAARARLDGPHAAYHAELEQLMHATRARFGRAVLIDWHSMPGRAVAGGSGVKALDVVLGDRHGRACDPALVRRARATLERAGWRVGLNRPYAGGWSTERWGRPDEGFHALQIEINRDLYLAPDLTPGPGFARVAAVATALAAALAEALGAPGAQTKKKPRPEARHESL